MTARVEVINEHGEQHAVLIKDGGRTYLYTASTADAPGQARRSRLGSVRATLALIADV